jgi:hypothetical protein
MGNSSFTESGKGGFGKIMRRITAYNGGDDGLARLDELTGEYGSQFSGHVSVSRNRSISDMGMRMCLNFLMALNSFRLIRRLTEDSETSSNVAASGILQARR